MSEKRETVYVTKWALTKGILKVEATFSAAGSAFWGAHGSAYGEGRGWHRTEDEAIKRAEEMRKAKIASLTKAITRLRKLAFNRSGR